MLDSENKRAASINIGLPFGRVYPKPDGSLTPLSDRQHMAMSYPLGAVGAPFNALWATQANQLVGPVLS